MDTPRFTETGIVYIRDVEQFDNDIEEETGLPIAEIAISVILTLAQLVYEVWWNNNPNPI